MRAMTTYSLPSVNSNMLAKVRFANKKKQQQQTATKSKGFHVKAKTFGEPSANTQSQSLPKVQAAHPLQI